MPSAIREPSEYHILDQPHSKRCRMKIIHVGAGAAGLLTAYKAKKSLTDYELMCYEKSVSLYLSARTADLSC
jgi:ribulose 1,5-bisphosphate synthetase/thiazole synthase